MIPCQQRPRPSPLHLFGQRDHVGHHADVDAVDLFFHHSTATIPRTRNNVQSSAATASTTTGATLLWHCTRETDRSASIWTTVSGVERDGLWHRRGCCGARLTLGVPGQRRRG